MRQRVHRALAPVLFVLALAVPASAQLTTQTIVESVDGIVSFVQDPVLPDTFYLVQRTGKVLVRQGGTILPTPLIDLTGQLGGLDGEGGLLGLAFAPRTDTRWFFVNFVNSSGDTVIARFTREAGSPTAGGRLDLRWPGDQPFIDQPPAENHKGGHLAFGSDGYLYIGLGDGGGGNDQFNNAQNPNTLLGKMLRIDINVDAGDAKGYRIPTSNPFVGFSTGIVHHEIWAFGLRNPWRYSIDNPLLGGTGALIIGDVGQGAREEIDYQPNGVGGRNYGWPNREGSIATPGVSPSHPTVPIPFTQPLVDYPHPPGGGQSVVGGYVYRGSALPASFRGRYFVADFVSGLVASVGLAINPQNGEATFANVLDHTAALGGDGIVSFAEDRSGELYIVRSFGGPAVTKIVAVGVPSAPQSLTGNVNGTTVSLQWTPPASGTPNEYQLEVGSQANGSNLLVLRLPGTQTALSAPGIANGRYFVRVRAVNGGLAGAPSEELSLLVGCEAPPPTPGTLTRSLAGNQVTLEWAASPGASGYLVYALLPNNAIISVPVAAETTSIMAAVPPGAYQAAVVAQNACGSSPLSNIVSFMVP